MCVLENESAGVYLTPCRHKAMLLAIYYFSDVDDVHRPNWFYKTMPSVSAKDNPNTQLISSYLHVCDEKQTSEHQSGTDFGFAPKGPGV